MNGRLTTVRATCLRLRHSQITSVLLSPSSTASRYDPSADDPLYACQNNSSSSPPYTILLHCIDMFPLRTASICRRIFHRPTHACHKGKLLDWRRERRTGEENVDIEIATELIRESWKWRQKKNLVHQVKCSPSIIILLYNGVLLLRAFPRLVND